MKGNWKEISQNNNLFKPVYCLECKQRKVCGELNSDYCCPCWYQGERQKAEEYSDYQQVFRKKEQEGRKRIQQLKLLRNYQGCKRCWSLKVDAYHLYQESKLVCQPCLAREKGSSSSPINFLEQSKWYKRCWKIDLTEWLEKSCLPINSHCAKKWLKDKEHLKICDCLEQESQEIYDLFVNSLKKCQKQLNNCSCQESEKIRVSYLDNDGSGWTYCEKCEKRIASAGHHGIIKNRNSPNFWGLEIAEKVLCLDCLKEFQEQMPLRKKYLLDEYLKRYNF